MSYWPDYIVESCKTNSREPNPDRMSVTDLADPPLIRTLKMLHWDDIVQSPENSMNMLEGNMMDASIKHNCRNGLTNMKMEVKFGDKLLVGCQDIYYPPGVIYGAEGEWVDGTWTWTKYLVSDGLLVDAKYTSIWNLREAKDAWKAQLNIYRYMMSRICPDLPVNSLEIHAIGRDWRRNEKLRYGKDYPDHPFVVLKIPMWDNKATEQYINTQLHDHTLYSERRCTDDEVWAKPDTYAVHKTGRKSAMRVLNSSKEAYKWCEEKGHILGEKGVFLEKRVGERIRCVSYCQCKPFCKHAKAL